MAGRKVLFVLVVLIAVLMVPWSAWAGGWAVTTLDELPDLVAAGEPVTIGFVVRQHGKEARAGLTPTVGATHRASGESFTLEAVEDRAAHYSATLTFPTEGEWEWWIDGFGMQQPMPDLTVLSARGQRGDSSRLPAMGAMAGAAGLFGGALLWARTRRWGIAVVAVSVAVLAAAVIAAFSSAPAAAASAPPPTDPVVHGADLFVAKGCVVCHTNSRADVSVGFSSLNMGPNLSTYSNDPELLRAWLRDPDELKPGATMPDLDLSEEEIEAIIAFLNARN